MIKASDIKVGNYIELVFGTRGKDYKVIKVDAEKDEVTYAFGSLEVTEPISSVANVFPF